MNNNTLMTVSVITKNGIESKIIDLSKLRLSQLMILRGHLIGEYNNWITKIDAILNDIYLPDYVCTSLNNKKNRTIRKIKERKNSMLNKYSRR